MEQFPVNLDMYVGVVGFFLPVLIAIINKSRFSQTCKYCIAFATVLVATAGHLWFMGEFNLTDIPGTVLKMLFMTIGSYLIFWKPSGISDRIETGVNK